MSTRTLIEINHDRGPQDGDLEFVAALARYEDAADYAPACHVMKAALKAALLAAAGEVEG